jgi:Leucine-rich repeat (LRR) protein
MYAFTNDFTHAASFCMRPHRITQFWASLAPTLTRLTWRDVRRALPRAQQLRVTPPRLPFPQSMCALSSLVALDIGYCGLTEVPLGVFALSTLTSLSLEGNQLTALTRGRYKVSLHHLGLEACGLAALPPGLEAFVALRTLCLARNPRLAVGDSTPAVLDGLEVHGGSRTCGCLSCK